MTDRDAPKPAAAMIARVDPNMSASARAARFARGHAEKAASRRESPRESGRRGGPDRCGSSAVGCGGAFSRRRPHARLADFGAPARIDLRYPDPPSCGVVEGARVVDLFAGSGALGIEALSRGAKFALFVDNGPEARALLRANVEVFALGGVTRIWRADATLLGKAPAGPPFTLAFLDPPYDKGLAGPALTGLVEGGWLASGALVVIEESAEAEIGAPTALRIVDERVYGETKVVFLAYGDEGFRPSP